MSSNKHHTEQLSREEIQTYLSTQHEQQKRAIEGKALEHEFDAEALEGWSSYGTGISDLRKLDKKFNPSPAKGWMMFSIATVLVTVTGIVFFSRQQPESNTMAAVHIEKTDVLLPDSVQQLRELPKTALISVGEVKKRPEKKSADPESAADTKKPITKEQVSVDQLPLLKPEFPSHVGKLSKLEAKEIYLNNLKLIDYRAYRKRSNLTIESIQLTGVPADKEKEEQTVQDAKVFDLEVAYYDYIKKTTELLNEENYKQALARCNIILAHYPDDLNALFYSGLCYYNLSEYDKSIELFKHCLTNKFSNFDEEAEWMLAKSYEASGDSNKAKAIFQLIKERGGYYSKKL